YFKSGNDVSRMKRRIKMKKVKVLVLVLCLLLSFTVCGQAVLSQAKNDIVILFTSDVHGSVDSGWTYSGIDVIRKQLIANGNHVILVDNGDAVQGDPLATMT